MIFFSGKKNQKPRDPKNSLSPSILCFASWFALWPNKIVKVFLGLSLTCLSLTSCEKYEPRTYSELRDRMHTTFIGSQSGNGQQFFKDEEVQLFEIDDSSTMIVGRFYDSLIIKIKTVDYSEGLVSGGGDSVRQFIYIDDQESLAIYKDFQNYFLYMFDGKRKK